MSFGPQGVSLGPRGTGDEREFEHTRGTGDEQEFEHPRGTSAEQEFEPQLTPPRNLRTGGKITVRT